LVGTSRNKGSFKGDLDDVRVYNETLSGAEVAALAAVAIPEPTSGILLSLASLALLRRRR
jgi:hypothetical protein